MKLARETVLLAALGLADLGHTVYFIHTGVATEANPILSFYLRSGLLPFIAIKLLLTLGPLAILELLRGYPPRLLRPQFIQCALRLSPTLYVLCYILAVCKANLG